MAGSLLWVGSAWARKKSSDLDCVIEPYTTVELSSTVPGILSEINVRRGDIVKKGQVVARLKSGVEEAGVKLAEARATSLTQIESNEVKYQLAQRNLERVNELFEKNMISKDEQDKAETDALVAKLDVLLAREGLKVAQLELERTKEILNLRSILSPIDGIVVDRLKSPGEYVEEQPVVKLAQIDPLNVEVIAPLSWLGSIKPGMKAKIMPEEPVGGEYRAVVKIVDPVIHAPSGTFGIRLELPNPKHKVFAGLRCNIKFLK